MKLGEVVQLKSGGPLMTVKRHQEAHCFKFLGYEIERKAYAICEWYDDDKRIRDFVTSRFLPEQLQVVPSLSDMNFRDLKNFELEAAARRISK
jgi:uncharacterized protein YodC (DUF2158 family)